MSASPVGHEVSAPMRPERFRAAIRWGFVIGAVVLAFVAWAVVRSDDAEATSHCGVSLPYANEADMRDSLCRERLADPGVGKYLQRGDIISGNRQALFNDWGFTDNFLWYSLEHQITVSRSQNLRWTYCEVSPNFTSEGDTCIFDGGFVSTFPIFDDPNNAAIDGSFTGNSQDLIAFEWDGAFIAAVCGNFVPPNMNDKPKPVPSITGKKTDAITGDPIPGWTIELYRDATEVGQPLGFVTNTTTNASGDYIFDLDGLGPGTYRVQEDVQAGWVPVGAIAHSIDVDFGVGDHQFDGNDFSNKRVADIEKSDATMTVETAFGPEIDVNTPGVIEVEALVTNNGPYGPVTIEDTLVATSVPPDCILGAIPPQTFSLDAGESTLVHFDVDIECSQRSFHEVAFQNSIQLLTSGVEDPPGNNTAVGSVTFEVYDYADLSVDAIRVICDEYWAGNPFTCSVETDVSNLGPADDVHIDAAVTLGGSPACATDIARTQNEQVVLDAGESTTLAHEWVVTCPAGTLLHTFKVTSVVAPGEPHIRDLNAGNDMLMKVWIPQDLKPNSDPNTLNMKRGGVTAVALLSTPDLDTTTEVDAATLFFGPTGTEAPVVRCGAPEDANGDGLLDLVCKFRLQDTGFGDGDELGIVTGFLTDGTMFMSADQVRVLNA